MKIAPFRVLRLCPMILWPAALAAGVPLLVASHLQAETVQRGDLRVSFSAKIQPKLLPRHGRAPIAVELGGRTFTTDGAQPPPLRGFEIELNREGSLDPGAVPICRLDQIQPASTANALRACRAAKVGEGSFGAEVLVPSQSPFPSQGRMIAFNGVEHGKPVIFAHVYGTQPVPTSYTLVLRIAKAHGTFGTALRAALPRLTGKVAHVTQITLELGRGNSRGAGKSYLSAGCPAPSGFSRAVFPLARVSFDFAGGRKLGTVLTRGCSARG